MLPRWTRHCPKTHALLLPRAFGVVALLAMPWFTACGAAPHGAGAGLRSKSLDATQSAEDFGVLAASFRELYGALAYKEQRFGFSFATLVDRTRTELSNARNDGETIGAFKRFTAAFHDAHVHLTIPGNSSHVTAYDLPVYINPFGGKALVTDSPEAGELGIATSDELVAVDGTSVQDILSVIRRYEAYATAASDAHLVNYALHRPFYMAELIPQQATAVLTLARADGSTYQVETPWIESRSDTGATRFPTVDADFANYTVAQSGDLDRGHEGAAWSNGAPTPFFATSAVASRYGLVPVTPSADTLKKFGLGAGDAADIYAALYKYKDRVVLLIRQPVYLAGPGGNFQRQLQAYKAILAQFQKLADVLVIDQTHNPGGDLNYAEAFAAMLLQQPVSNTVQQLHADRRWIYSLQSAARRAIGNDNTAQKTTLDFAARAVDAAIDQGQTLTAPLPLVGLQTLRPDAQVQWQKPILMLVDELSGSCGDIVPMLLQRSGRAKIFGATTMGAGGNVEGVATLPNSQIGLNLSRGLFTSYHPDHRYPATEIVENNGITPDLPYAITPADVRGGLLGYVEAFSAAAIAQIPPS